MDATRLKACGEIKEKTALCSINIPYIKRDYINVFQRSSGIRLSAHQAKVCLFAYFSCVDLIIRRLLIFLEVFLDISLILTI